MADRICSECWAYVQYKLNDAGWCKFRECMVQFDDPACKIFIGCNNDKK